MSASDNAARARQCVDRVLVALGQRPLADNPEFRQEHMVGRDFVFVLHSKEAAPLRLEFGYEFEVGVGPFSEVFVVLPDNEVALESVVRRVLTSQVRVEQHQKAATVEFVDPADGKAWLKTSRRTLWGEYLAESTLESVYPPAFSIDT